MHACTLIDFYVKIIVNLALMESVLLVKISHKSCELTLSFTFIFDIVIQCVTYPIDTLLSQAYN